MLAIFTALVLSEVAFEIGTINIRLFDIGVVILLITFIFSESNVFISKSYNFVLAVFMCLLAYSAILLPFQSYPLTNSILDIIELIEYVVVLSIFFSLLIHKKSRQDILILDIVWFMSFLGSLTSIVIYIVFDITPTIQWYAIGIPAFGIYYSIEKYAVHKNWHYIGVALIFILRVLIGQTRSMYIFIPLSALFTLLIREYSLYFILQYVKDYKLKSFSFIGLFSTVVFILLPTIRESINSILNLSHGFLVRPTRWLASLNVFTQHPFGVGLGNNAVAIHEFALSGAISFPDWYVSIYSSGGVKRELARYKDAPVGIHSDFFGLLTDLGLIGGVLFIVLWIFIFKKIIVSPNLTYSFSVIATIIYFFFQQLVNPLLLAGSQGMLFIIFLSIFSTWIANNKIET